MFSTIRVKIKEKLLEMTTLQSVYLTNTSKFSDGFPVAVISPSENQTDYGSTSKDKRVFVFKVRLYYPITSQDNQETEELALEKVVDEVILAFNRRNLLDPACDWVEPIPSVWEYEERDGSVYRVGEITLRCIKYV